MTRALLLLIIACACFQAGYNSAMRKTLHDDVFGDATVGEIQQANNIWRE